MKLNATAPLRCAALLLIALAVAGCGGAGTQPVKPEATAEPTPVPAATLLPLPEILPLVVDTDMGRPDVLALFYLLARDDVEIRAITMVGDGEGICRPGVQNARGIVALMDQAAIPVACGPDQPLRGSNHFPQQFRSRTLSFPGLELPEVEQTGQGDAVQLLTDTLLDSPSKVVLLTIGPLTNVAEALSARPEIATRIDHIVAMGGAVRVDGNVEEQPSAEWNLYVDPYADRVVFDSGIPITLVPLDATNDVPSAIFTLQALDHYHQTRAAQAVYDMYQADPSLYDGFTYFWDALAAAVVVEPELVELETMQLKVVQDGPDQGRTVEDDDGAEITVAIGADRSGFETNFISILNGGVAVTLPKPEADAQVTFDGANCVYDGPASVPAGLLVVNVTNNGSPDSDFGMAIVTLEPDRGVDDLLALPNANKPPWATLLSFGGPQSGQHEYLGLSVDAGPLYLVCMNPEQVLSVPPPIEVAP